MDHTADWWLGDLTHPWFLELERAIHDEWGREPMRVREGGVRPPFILSSTPGPSLILSLSSHSPYHAYLSSKKPSVALRFTSRWAKAQCVFF